jgi:hypothetical protein
MSSQLESISIGRKGRDLSITEEYALQCLRLLNITEVLKYAILPEIASFPRASVVEAFWIIHLTTLPDECYYLGWRAK